MRGFRTFILLISALGFIACGRGFETNHDQRDFSNFSTDGIGAYQNVSRTGSTRNIVTDTGDTKEVYYTPAGYNEEFEDLKKRKEAQVSQVFTESIGQVKVQPGDNESINVDIEVEGNTQSFALTFDADTLIAMPTPPKTTESNDTSKQYELQAKCLSENCDLIEFGLVKNKIEEAAFIKQIKERELEVKASIPDDTVDTQPKDVLLPIVDLNNSEIQVVQESTTFVKGPSYSEITITKGEQSVLEINAEHLETNTSTTPAVAKGTSKPIEARVLGNNSTNGGLMVELSRNADWADGSGEAVLLKIKPKKTAVIADVTQDNEDTENDDKVPAEPATDNTETSTDTTAPQEPVITGVFKTSNILAPTIDTPSIRQSTLGFEKLAKTKLVQDKANYLARRQGAGVRRVLSYLQPIEGITRKTFQALDVTPEFAYIKAAESKFIGPGFPIEVAGTGTAGGPWQILKGTAQGEIDRGLPYQVKALQHNPRSLHPDDDRGYYVPATHMAAQYIKSINDKYGYDPALVILSYHIGPNCDEGAGTACALKQARKKMGVLGKYQITFMEMLTHNIQTESFIADNGSYNDKIDYTLKIVAFRTIGKNPAKYDVTLKDEIDINGLEGKLMSPNRPLPSFLTQQDLDMRPWEGVALADR